MLSTIVPTKERKDSFVHAIFDGMDYDIPINLTASVINESLSSYEHHERFCQNKHGHLVSLDSPSKLELVTKLIKQHMIASEEQSLTYIIGKV